MFLSLNVPLVTLSCTCCYDDLNGNQDLKTCPGADYRILSALQPHAHTNTHSHTHTHSLSLVLVVMMKSKELKTKISHAHSLILTLAC